MKRGSGFLHPALALVLLAAPAGAAEILVRPAEGPDVRGQFSSLDRKTLRIHGPTGPQAFKLSELMAVEFPKASAPEGAECARIYTAAGDMIPAKVELGKAGRLAASGPWTGRFEINTKDLTGILMPAGLGDKAVLAVMARRSHRKDHVFLLGGDQLTGTFEGVTGKGFKFKSPLGEQNFKLEDILALAFAELKPSKPPKSTYFVAELAGGGQVAGAPVKLAGEHIEWRTLGGMKLKLAVSALAALRVRNGKVTFLSELKPVKVEQKPFIEGLPFVWKWRADRDVFGKELVLGGRRFKRGLGVAAFTKLTYRLEGAYKRFNASVGVSDSVAAGGKTVFRVLVDGKQSFATRRALGRGGAPQKVEVDVSGAKELSLVVDFGPDESDLGDIGGWGEARVVK